MNPQLWHIWIALLRAVFPDGEFLLDTLGPAKRTRSSTTPRAKQ